VIHRVTLIPGDGIGPEVIREATRVLEATGVGFDWDVHDAGATAVESAGRPVPDELIDSIQVNRVALKGPIGTPTGKGYSSPNVALRKAAGLYANIRPCRSFSGVPSRFDDVDLVIVRDTSEDLYSGIEFDAGSAEVGTLMQTIGTLRPDARIAEDAGITIKPISGQASRRVVQLAFEYARTNGRRKVTAVHKANLMKATDGLFLSVAKEVAAQNNDIEFDDYIVDALCAKMVRAPDEFDVVVCTMQYGDILSDLAAGLIGSVGIAPGVNVGTHAALFEPSHGSAPKYARQDRVNPIATILSGAMLLRHVGEVEAADRVNRAVAAVIGDGAVVTYDLKQNRDDPTAASTTAVADAVIAALAHAA
jgi:isocitrate dehydrogenase (NAD+)